MIDDALYDYIRGHIEPEPPELQRLYRRTHLQHLYPRMCSGHIQGRLLKMLAAMIRPHRVLELGTFTGYSALSLAEGMPVGSELTTVEIDDEMEDELLELFKSNPRPATVKLIIGDALEVVPGLEGTWDMVFIDANKRLYPQYLEMLAQRINPGGYILADNTLWDGKIAETPAPSDAQSRGIMAFNDIAAQYPGFETVIIPIRDGLTVMRRL